jgi:hypothetical protein
MPTRFVFADEAGCFAFKKREGASKYFMLCTLTTDDCSVGYRLFYFERGWGKKNLARRISTPMFSLNPPVAWKS